LIVTNKWNKKTYKVLEIKGDKVTLEREDGSQFTIDGKEYVKNYIKNA
jgi:co-chaperonin GroES (HSP10)